MAKGFFSAAPITKPRTRSLVPACGACGLCSGCESPKMSITGDGDRRVLIIAEAPGKQEDAEGTQLVGTVGRYLRGVLDSLDVDLDIDCWKTNAICCRPSRNRKPTKAEIEYCRPNILAAIRELKPEVIILLGGSAVSSVVGHFW